MLANIASGQQLFFFLSAALADMLKQESQFHPQSLKLRIAYQYLILMFTFVIALVSGYKVSSLASVMKRRRRSGWLNNSVIKSSHFCWLMLCQSLGGEKKLELRY